MSETPDTAPKLHLCRDDYDDPTPVIQDQQVVFSISCGPLIHMLAVDRLLLEASAHHFSLYDHIQFRFKEACKEIEARPEYQNWLKNGP
jgi:hypothetical protein